MINNREIHIDIYHSISDKYGLTYIENKLLYSSTINSDINMDDLVRKIIKLIFDYYGDGLYIIAEDFDDVGYINIYLLFGEDYFFLTEYFDSINNNGQIPPVESKSIKSNGFIHIENIFDDSDYEKLERIFKEYGVEAELYSKQISAFEKGAGDFHIDLLILALEPIRDSLVAKLKKVFGKSSIQIVEFDVLSYRSYVATLVNEAERFLKFQSSKIVNKESRVQEVIFTSRKNKIILHVDIVSGKIVESEVLVKSQTGIG